MTPRLIVEVRGGRSAGTKVAIDPGRALRFGRTELADVVVPHDEMLSGVHFELSWDGVRGRLRDRNSMEGTTLCGRPVIEAEVAHGEWIRAGMTDFVAYVEGHTPPREDEDDEIDKAERALREAHRVAAEKALASLRREAEREPLYAIVDAARDDRILEILRESVERHQSLYEGLDGEALDHVAPYLAGPMQGDSALLERLVIEGWASRWGIYVASQAPFREVRRHFRRFLMVELEETGAPHYFRFYDPSVMEIFLSTATDAQRAEVSAGGHRVLSADAIG